jgi:hypothetical protein
MKGENCNDVRGVVYCGRAHLEDQHAKGSEDMSLGHTPGLRRGGEVRRHGLALHSPNQEYHSDPNARPRHNRQSSHVYSKDYARRDRQPFMFYKYLLIGILVVLRALHEQGETTESFYILVL